MTGTPDPLHSYEFLLLVSNLSYFLLVVAFFMREIFYIRSIFCLACVSAIAYFYFLPDGPHWIQISAIAFLILVNLIQLLVQWIETKSLQFKTEQERMLYQTVFKEFSQKQFKKLMRIGTIEHAEPGKTLTNEGRPVQDVILILDGIANVEAGGKTIAYCTAGNLVGEMSFISGKPANATVIVTEPTTFIRWKQEELGALLESDISMKQAMLSVFNVELIRKLSSKA